MAVKKLGKQTVKFESPPYIISSGTVAGKREGEGPLGGYFDMVLNDELWGEKSWEKTECHMLLKAVEIALEKQKLAPDDIDYMLSGDLLNQIITSSFAARELQIPFFGLYGACSTMAETLSLGSMLIDGGFADKVVCATSSHFCTAERQYRFPLELGTQRTPTAQWTVTGAGAVVLSNEGTGPCIKGVTTGKVVDFGITDANDMGAAMAPSAADTFQAHFKDTNRMPEYYDLILTGDLGMYGRDLVRTLISEKGIDLGDRYLDCGCEIFAGEKGVNAGGSGCGCSAVSLCGWVMEEMKRGKYQKILFEATGALLSTTSSQQGESIPGIAHAVIIEN